MSVTGDADNPPTPEEIDIGKTIKHVRKRVLDWSQSRLGLEMQIVADRIGTGYALTDSRKTQISRWENGKIEPEEFNKRLLCACLGLPPEALGLPPDTPPLRPRRTHTSFDTTTDSGDGSSSSLG
jgi:transcriptional regulator with XRE-family HTH domain